MTDDKAELQRTMLESITSVRKENSELTARVRDLEQRNEQLKNENDRLQVCVHGLGVWK